MHLFKPSSGSNHSITRGILSHSAFHQFRQGVKSFNAGQFLVRLCVGIFELWLVFVAVCAWRWTGPALGIVFLLPAAFGLFAIVTQIKPTKPA